MWSVPPTKVASPVIDPRTAELPRPVRSALLLQPAVSHLCFADDVAKRIPARRIGSDEDMAGIAIYLASRAGDYVVGNTIAVDGGVVYANAGLEIAG